MRLDLILFSLLPAAANGAIAVYNNPTAWANALAGAPTVEDLSDEVETTVALTPADQLILNGSDIRFQVTEGDIEGLTNLAIQKAPDQISLRLDPDNANRPQEFTVTVPVGFSAIGINFEDINTASALTRTYIQVQGTTIDLFTVMGASDGFIGITSDTDITSFTLDNHTHPNGLDDFRITGLQLGVVPEPGTTVLALAGLLGIIGQRRR